jgi:hypothetical protein
MAKAQELVEAENMIREHLSALSKDSQLSKESHPSQASTSDDICSRFLNLFSRGETHKVDVDPNASAAPTLR